MQFFIFIQTVCLLQRGTLLWWNVQYHRLWPISFMLNPGSMKREQYTIIPILMVRMIKDLFMIILCHTRTVEMLENTESVRIEFPHLKSFPTQNFISGFNILSHSKLRKITNTYHTTWLVSSFRYYINFSIWNRAKLPKKKKRDSENWLGPILKWKWVRKSVMNVLKNWFRI